MTRRLNYHDVKDYVENQGYQLVSERYSNNKENLDMLCGKGHPCSIAFDKFKNAGRRCGECGKVNRAESKLKFKYDEVVKIFKEEGCELLCKTYRTMDDLLEYVCICGEESVISLYRFLKGVRCQGCAGNKKYTIEEVREYFEAHGAKLISTEYNNMKSSDLKYICPRGHNAIGSFYGFTLSHGCYECRNEKIGESQRHDYKFVKKFFEENGCKLLSTTYKNSTHQKLKYVCVCGNASAEIRFCHFKQGIRCQECRKKLMSEILSGENHYNYNPDISDEDRVRRRIDDTYREWRSKVYTRDRYTCVCCGESKSNEMVAHHKDSWNSNVERRYDVDNGVTLCDDCHNSFHHLYGYGYNTEEQFNEFLVLYRDI